jgi:chromosome segregation ATPase
MSNIAINHVCPRDLNIKLKAVRNLLLAHRKNVQFLELEALSLQMQLTSIGQQIETAKKAEKERLGFEFAIHRFDIAVENKIQTMRGKLIDARKNAELIKLEIASLEFQETILQKQLNVFFPSPTTASPSPPAMNPVKRAGPFCILSPVV